MRAICYIYVRSSDCLYTHLFMYDNNVTASELMSVLMCTVHLFAQYCVHLFIGICHMQVT